MTRHFAQLLQHWATAVAFALALLFSTPSLVKSQVSIPPHALSKERNGRSCEVALLPKQSLGEQPPLLVFTVDDKTGYRISAKLKTAASAVELVAANTRSGFSDIRARNLSLLQRTTVWEVVKASFEAEAPYFLTARYADGSYGSSRYEAVNPKGIIEIFAKQCGVETPESKKAALAKLMEEDQKIHPEELHGC